MSENVVTQTCNELLVRLEPTAPQSEDAVAALARAIDGVAKEHGYAVRQVGDFHRIVQELKSEAALVLMLDHWEEPER